MDKMSVDVEQDGSIISFVNDMILEDFVVQSTGWWDSSRHVGARESKRYGIVLSNE